MSVADNIKYLRKKRKMTQKELAEKSGLAVITIQQYEAGKYNPKPEAVIKLCVGLDCRITDIIDDEQKKYYRIFDNMHIASVSSDDIILIEPDIFEYNRIIDKQKSGDGYTPHDIRFISDYIKNNSLVREQFVISGLKSFEKNMHDIHNAYDLLNDEGRKKAAEQIEMLSKIPEYQKEPETKTAAPEREPQDGETDTH